MKKLFLISLFFLALMPLLQAKPVDKNTALRVARNFYTSRMSSDHFPGISTSSLINYSGKPNHYVINLKNNKGFIIVSADDVAIPVWAYAFIGNFDTQQMPENVLKTMEDYEKQLTYLINNKIPATKAIAELWRKYIKGRSSKAAPPAFGPLLTSVWSQGCFYNDSTPVDPAGPCGHVVTGCVATAMAQVLFYHQSPNSGSGFHSYNSNYGTLSADFANTTYNWTAMTDTLDAQSSAAAVSAVATLISHCGIAVDMNYTAGSSGAYSADAANAFVHYFNYDLDLSLKHRDNYPDSVWEQMVRTELDSLRPLYYDGSGSGGHAFVCDGYQGSHYFHFNWGWSGSYNGYFLLSQLNPGGMNFSNYCGAVFGMKPGVPKSCSSTTDTLLAKEGNISDGSYGFNYQNNQNCSWLISPAGAAGIQLEFFTFDLQSGDSVFIYDGNNSQSPLIGAYSGNSLPAAVSSSGGQMFIQFQTNAQNVAGGWSAHYMAEFCDGLKVFSNNMSGTFSDGSGADTYNNNTNCYWLMTDSANRPIHLDFNYFLTEASYDFVDVYDGTSTNATLLGSFSGHQIPQTLVSSGGAMLLHFHSDGGVVDQGWEAHYYICADPAMPYPAAQADICSGDSLLLQVPVAVDSFVWFKDGIAQTGNFFRQWYVTQSGNYYYEAYVGSCAAKNSDTISVNVHPLPQIDLGNDTMVCTGTSLVLNAGSGFDAYLWSTGDTSSWISLSSSSAGVQNIAVQVSDSNSCSATDSIRVEFIVCTGIESPEEGMLDIYPNPATDRLNVKLPEQEREIFVVLYDARGQEVLRRQFHNLKELQLDVSSLSAGNYYLEINSGAKVWKAKLLIR